MSMPSMVKECRLKYDITTFILWITNDPKDLQVKSDLFYEKLWKLYLFQLTIGIF